MTSAAPAQPAATVPSEVAAGWLAFWRSLGGGATITVTGDVALWRWIPRTDPLASLADSAADLFESTPGMDALVRQRLEAEIQPRTEQQT